MILLSWWRRFNRPNLTIRGTEDHSLGGVDYSHPQDEQDLSDHFPVMATFSMADASTPTPGPTPPTNEEIRALLLEKITQIENEIAELMEELQEVKTLLGERED